MPRDERIEMSAIPGELIERPQWVVWRYKRRGRKRTKVPLCPEVYTPPVIQVRVV
jgi:primase-polymerase (primpol)-like protein